ncbi:hypothetical protein [Micromonospora sp. KC723]|uniref:hypothetical protein n=1 Tax=Micromonospora sp. KC723 TaxID=2530381 RepID=UPI001047C63D|nr:hypothetical protein [Micromonospora sp. KC723]TDB72745.1 hypothetical protein E1165_19320 [Micromonospora sp. KC723]
MSQPPANPYPPQPDNGEPHGSYPPPQPGDATPPQPGDNPSQPGPFPPAQPGIHPAPGQPYPAAPGAPAAKKSNVGKILLISLAAVLVLCLGGAAVAFFAVKDEAKEAVEAVEAANTRVVAPETLAGRAKSTDPSLLEGAKQLEAELNKSLPDATSTAGAFYGTVERKDLVMVAAASGRNTDPAKTLDDTISGAGQADLQVKEMKSVDAGPLGGLAKCGDAEASTVPLGICVWSDKGSIGMIIIYFKGGQEAANELSTMRGQIQQKN